MDTPIVVDPTKPKRASLSESNVTLLVVALAGLLTACGGLISSYANRIAIDNTLRQVKANEAKAVTAEAKAVTAEAKAVEAHAAVGQLQQVTAQLKVDQAATKKTVAVMKSEAIPPPE